MSEGKEAAAPSELQGKRILVTGGAGYIGSHTVVELIGQGADITVVDNLVNASRVSLARIKEITGVAPAFYEVDLCDAQGLDRVFQEQKAPFDAVIHFAGLKAVGESAQLPLRYYDNNLTGTLYLLKAMKKYGCTRLVFSSSATVYGLTDKVPIKETEPTHATNPYGWTKLMIEQILRDEANGSDGKQWRISLLRYFNPIGAHPSGLIGEDPKGIPNNLLPYITQVAVGKLPHVNVFGSDWPTKDGTGLRDYIHVVDLARGHLAALQHHVFGTSDRRCDEFNLGTGVGSTVLEMIAAVEKASGKKIPYKLVDRRAGDVAQCYADPSKAASLLHWKAHFSIERAVEDAWRWQSGNPDGYAGSEEEEEAGKETA